MPKYILSNFKEVVNPRFFLLGGLVGRGHACHFEHWNKISTNFANLMTNLTPCSVIACFCITDGRTLWVKIMTNLFGRTLHFILDGRTDNVNIMITTGLNCGRPNGSITKFQVLSNTRLILFWVKILFLSVP